MCRLFTAVHRGHCDIVSGQSKNAFFLKTLVVITRSTQFHLIFDGWFSYLSYYQERQREKKTFVSINIYSSGDKK